MRRVRAGAWLTLLFLLAACQAPIPSATELPENDPRAASLMAALETTAANRRSLRAEARFSLDAPDLRLRRPERLVVERPAKLRVEISGLFGQVAAVLVTDGERYQFLEASRGQIEQGVVDAALLWRLARIDLEPQEAVSLLLGAPEPLPGFARTGAVALSDGSLAVSLGGGNGARQHFLFDAKGRPTRVTLSDADGEPVWDARFENYKEVNGTFFAHDILLTFPRVDAHASVQFKKVELNPDLSGVVFVLQLGDRSS